MLSGRGLRMSWGGKHSELKQATETPQVKAQAAEKATRDARTFRLAVKLAEERRRAAHAEAELET